MCAGEHEAALADAGHGCVERRRLPCAGHRPPPLGTQVTPALFLVYTGHSLRSPILCRLVAAILHNVNIALVLNREAT